MPNAYRLNLLLPRQFILNCQCGSGCAARFLDLAVGFLDFAFQAKLEVVGPSIELTDPVSI
jgi:hypothetical protein